MKQTRMRFGPTAVVGAALAAFGCGGESEAPATATTAPAVAPLGAEEESVYRDLEGKVSALINDESKRFAPLRYEYSEGLLDTFDQIEKSLVGQAAGEPPRFLKELSAEEEREHFRETIRRWEAKTGRSLRKEVDVLKGDIAARKPGEAFHPEFQKKFSQSLDGLIAFEVEEIRERRNRAIHEKAEAFLAPHREKSPAAVRRIEELLDRPPYDVPKTTAAPAPAAKG